MMMVTISECQSPDKDQKSAAKPSACLSSCFTGSVHSNAAAASDDDGERAGRTTSPRSPYAWLKSTAAHELPEIRGRCRSLIARLGRNGRRRHSSMDFSYDASSYALNFEDAYGRGDDDDVFPLRGFAARLPASPPPQEGVSGSGPIRREIVGFS